MVVGLGIAAVNHSGWGWFSIDPFLVVFFFGGRGGAASPNVEVENTDTGVHEILNLTTCSFNERKRSPSKNTDTVRSALYIKDRFSISNEAYHELSMVSDLPQSCRVQTLVHDMNSGFAISITPNGIIGVQQSLKDCITARLKKLVNNNGEQLP